MTAAIVSEALSPDQGHTDTPATAPVAQATAPATQAAASAHAAAADLPLAEPTPVGLIGLAFGCAALLPIAFGTSVSPQALQTAAVFCFLFGFGCQLVAGLLNYRNKNLLGATVFTAFAFNWALNAWALWSMSRGQAPDHAVVLAVEAASLVLFVPLTYAFGCHSKLLFLFLLDIDLIYVAKLLRGYGGVAGMDRPIAFLTLALGVIALWIALAMLVNPVAKRPIFPMPGPLFRPQG